VSGLPPRRILWIYGEATRTRRWATTLLATVPPKTVAWVGTHPPETAYRLVPVGGARQLLGRTLGAGVLDAHAGFDPDDFGALSGTIAGGGALLLLSPPPRRWIGQPDSALQPLVSHGLSLRDFRGHFIDRLIRHLEAFAPVEALDADSPSPEGPDPVSDRPGRIRATEVTATTDQRRIVDAIARLARGEDPARLFITADRGRGKSAALGMAVAALADQRVRLTAPSRAAASTVLAHAGPTPPEFIAPESVTPEDTLLLIDEAAALPLPLVARLAEENPRCVLTGTVHGYEGSGRGLILQLAGTLAEAADGLHRHILKEPVRWSADDPLETLTHRLLLLAAEPATGIGGDPQSWTIQCEDPATLITGEADLEAIFGLLVAGHYQTRPRDLRQLLDDPEMQLWTLREGGMVVGVLAARREGGMDPAMVDAIHRGERRPAGHLIAQSLTFHAGIANAAGYQGLRIQRIAVHPQRRRLGFGRHLVTAAREAASEQALDWLGASFAGTGPLLDFWHACGMDVVRVGNRRDPRSGEHAVIVLTGLSEGGRMLLTRARARLAVHLPDQCRHALQELPRARQRRLSRGLPSADTATVDSVDLQVFAHGHRSLLDTHGALERWGRQIVGKLSPAEQSLLAAAIRDPLNTTAMARSIGASGRREALTTLRQLVRDKLESDHE